MQGVYLGMTGNQVYKRNQESWLRICHEIKAGHVPMGEGKWGGVEATYWEGIAMPKLFLIPPLDGDVVLDLGCGNGRLAIALLDYNVTYIGVDPVQESASFCQNAFRPWESYTFQWANVRTPTYTPRQLIDPIGWRFPVSDNWIDWAAAISVFTHLCTEEIARHYLAEFARVVRRDGVLWTTWFKSPPNEPTEIVQRTAYTEGFIRGAIENAGFEIKYTQLGETTAQHDQWHVWAVKK